MTRKITFYLFIAALFGMLSCSDDSTGPGDTEADSGEGAISVTGAVQAEHEGIAWYSGLRSDTGGYNNLTMEISELPPDELGDTSFGLSIIMVGDDGPFDFDPGVYEIGQSTNGALVMVNYRNSVSDESLHYATTPNSGGTVTIQSVSDTNVEAVLSITLEAGPSTEEGEVTITGEINAECITAAAGGITC
jgi:hypothetical protein